MERFMKFKILFIFILLFSSCCAIPGYINKDGAITPKYFKEIQIESIKGFVSITPVETSKGITNINPAKSDPLVSKKQNTIYLNQGNSHYYTIEGNHSVIFSLRTLDDEAIIKITYKNKTTEYTIHNSDISDKLVYCDNY